MPHPPSAVAPSCLECRRRKIKCDRSLPCSYCVKVKIQCSYSPPSVTSQNTEEKKVDTDVVARIERIEQTLVSFDQGLSQIRQLLQAKSSSLVGEGSYAHDVAQRHEIEYGDVELHEDLSWLNKEDELNPGIQPPHPSSELIAFLWQTYLERVEPVLKVFHAPTVQKQVMDFIRGRGFVDRPTTCLIFAIYYASVITMTVEECQTGFNKGKHEVLKRYRIIVEYSLSKAKLRESTDMTILQAFAIYLICGRRDDQGPDVRASIGTAIGIAFRIGLHRDGAALGMAPFQVEMRRRLWWQIYILDIRTAEDHGVDPRILDSWFDTRLPSNVNDASLDFEMQEPPPTAHGRTDMLFTLLRLEISNFSRQVVFSDQFCSDNSYPILSVSQKCKAIDIFKERIEMQYLSRCDKGIPLDFITAASSRLILVKLKLTVSKPRERLDQAVLIQENFRMICIEVLQQAQTLRSYEKCRQWLWLFQRYIEWDVLAYLFINLALLPKGGGLDLAWEVAEETHEYWKTGGDMNRLHHWESIKELRSKALLARQMIKSDPSKWEVSPGDNGVKQAEAPTIVSSQGSRAKVSKRRREDSLDSSLGQEDRSPKSRSELPKAQHNSHELTRPLALASSTAGTPAAGDYSLYTKPSTETTHIPSSGTACQWSPAIFESYFELLGSEHASTSL
ncbi:hypothetical protein V495_00440 [Pseudogymnoascus sp. VKM F-4514 (FW-929)]|nr:hypothetical protein V495_00440 [Pseudogymnoascus sp. VKM F-4514 (FW-929)]KFY62905.1 hypothetical protein V497_02163 [Pseudogymnoascus sp. VKM F-4516 (FW-969)]